VNARYFLRTVTTVNFEKQWEVTESRESNQQCQHTNFKGEGGIRRSLLAGLPSTPSPLTLTDLCTTIRANWTSHGSPGNAYTASYFPSPPINPGDITLRQLLKLRPIFLCLFFSNYNIPGVLSPSSSVNGTGRAARSYGSISGMRSGSFQRSNSNSNLYIPGTTPPQLFSAGSGYQPSTLVEQNEG